MAVSAYVRLRVLWGVFDITAAQATTPGYTTTQFASGGPSAVQGSGVGVRRCTVTIDRTLVEASLDPASIHFDFLNMTAGNPDDTWTTTDYTTLEGYITTFWNAIISKLPPNHVATAYTWHRVGAGVTKPNPAERILSTPGVSMPTGTGVNAPQVACSITFRTGVRRSWGRTYLPYGGVLTSARRIPSADVTAIANAMNTLVTSAASSDFHLVVTSGHLSSSLNVEHIEVDDVSDIVRRRRHKRSVTKTILP